MTTNKVCLYVKTLVFIHLEPNVRYAARVSITRINHKKMGNDLVIKCVSTPSLQKVIDSPMCNNADSDWHGSMQTNPHPTTSKVEMLLKLWRGV